MINAFCLALETLTAIRPPVAVRYDEKSFGHSLIFFPIIGILLGSLQFALLIILRPYPIPIPLQSILLIVVNVLFTGGLHLDGVADTADAFGTSENTNKILAIMKDERLGVFGVAAVALLLYSRILVYQWMLERNDVFLFIFVPAISRFFLATTILLFPYARKSGKALPFSQARYSIPSSIAVVCFIPIFIFFAQRVVLLSLILWLLFQTYVYSKIRGYTGDTLGCLNEVLEAGIPFTYLCLRGIP